VRAEILRAEILRAEILRAEILRAEILRASLNQPTNIFKKILVTYIAFCIQEVYYGKTE